MRLGQLTDEQPYKRVGICCGARCTRSAKRRGRPDVPLFRVSDSRYRCRTCFYTEAHYYP